MTPAQIAATALAAIALWLALAGVMRARAHRAQSDAELRAVLGPIPTDEEIETYSQLLHDHRHGAGTASSCGACRREAQTAADAQLDATLDAAVPTPRNSPW